MSELSITAAAREAPGHIGLIHDGRAYTFAELAALARDAGRALDAQRRHGAPSAVTVVAERSASTAALILAALEARTPAVLLHARATQTERASLLDLCAGLEHQPDLAAVLFTSGSSGRPKGVLLGREAFVASAAASAARLGWRAGDRWLCCLPLAHIGGLSIVTRCLIARACAVLDVEKSFSADRVAALVRDERVTLLSLVPTMLAGLLDAGWTPPTHLRAVLLGGAAAPPALVARARSRGVPVRLTYGMTETCSQICTEICTESCTEMDMKPGAGEAARPISGQDVPPGPAGRVGPPLPGVELEIAGGRIRVRGPMLCRGYLGAAAPFDADGWLDTGDRGFLDEEGCLHVLGRADDTIITGGENVDPGEVEAVLHTHPGVAAACVFAVADATWGQLVAAALACPDGAPDALELARFLAARLAPHKRPRLMCVLPALPLGPSGKVDRRQVADASASTLVPLRYR